MIEAQIDFASKKYYQYIEISRLTEQQFSVGL